MTEPVKPAPEAANPGCPGPSYREIIERDSTPVSDVLARRSNPPQSTADIPFERYTSRAFYDLEMERLWPRVWQIACREEYLRERGDYIVYDIGRYSIIVVRTDTNEIRGYHNSCLHRGTKLKASGSCGYSERLQCPFHGWTWQLDGRLTEVPCAWEFPHLDYDANRLPEVKVDTWNGFVFVNMDETAPSLTDYLEVLPEHFRHWRLDDWYTVVHAEKELACNWKTAQEAFMEAYHTPLVHPEMTHVVGDWNMQHDIFGQHISRDLCPMAVSSPTSTRGLTEQQLLDSMLLGDPETSKTGKTLVPEGSTARIEMARMMRSDMAERYGMDMTHLSDAEVIDSLKYNVFPNAIVYGSRGLPILQRFRPLGDSHERALMENLILRPVPPGEEPPEPAEPVRIPEEGSYCDVPGMDPFLGSVLDQDTAIMRWQSEGMRASRKGAQTLSTYQESRIRHLHDTIDKYLGL